MLAAPPKAPARQLASPSMGPTMPGPSNHHPTGRYRAATPNEDILPAPCMDNFDDLLDSISFYISRSFSINDSFCKNSITFSESLTSSVELFDSLVGFSFVCHLNSN